jgi:hypothetical protein
VDRKASEKAAGSVLVLGACWPCPRHRCKRLADCEELRALKRIIEHGHTEFVQGRIAECDVIVQVLAGDQVPELLEHLPLPSGKSRGWWNH